MKKQDKKSNVEEINETPVHKEVSPASSATFTSETTGNPYLMPAAILIAGILIAGAVIFADRDKGSGQVARGGAAQQQQERPAGDPKEVNPVSPDEHIYGNKDAQVTIIEYSDFQCPFCSRIHTTLLQVVNESKGDVRWVYRNFPLTSIHPNAQGAAVAAECVAELGGNDAFWKMADTLFEDQSKLGEEFYVATAKSLKIPETQFKTCIASGKYDQKIQAETQNGMDAGGSGTPYVIVVGKDGDLTPFSGALPYEQIKQIVTQAQGTTNAQ